MCVGRDGIEIKLVNDLLSCQQNAQAADECCHDNTGHSYDSCFNC